MTYFVYLDEFGHDGPWVSRTDPKYRESPVYGLAGLGVPADRVRHLNSWFFNFKQNLLREDPVSAGKPAYSWEKKGSALYTSANIRQYPELRAATRRLLDKVRSCDGFVFYVGVAKTHGPDSHSAERLHLALLREALKRLDQLCEEREACFYLLLDGKSTEKLGRAVQEQAMREMFSPGYPRRCLVERPRIVSSLDFQLMQYADWLCGLIGRLTASQVQPEQYPDWEWAGRLFGQQLREVTVRSGIRPSSGE